MIAVTESNKNLPLKMEFLMTSIFTISGCGWREKSDISKTGVIKNMLAFRPSREGYFVS